MKKILTKIPKSYLILIVVLAFLVQTNITNAESVASLFLGHSSLLELVYTLLAYLANTALTISSWLLIAAGSILDVSIRLTLNIKDFVDGTPAIFTVWKNLRDITGLFFIFFLLYAAIQMITGYGKGPSYGTTIKNIVIAGILINFSFFIVSVAIDASNVVSQAIYNAMVPNKVLMKMDTKSNIAKLIESTPEKSRISNIFMNSLRIQSIYDTSGNRLKTNASDPVKIVLVGITGTIMMLTTAASFIFAAIAFIARLGILIFVLAFSSIWFAGTVIPQLGKETGKLVSVFTSQLLFMPVYLILMYVALSVISGSNFLLAGDVSNIVLPTGANWTMPYIILGINFAIVIFLLNLPLAVGLSMGGMAVGWMKNGMGKWDAMNVWKNVGLWSKDRSASGAVGAWKNTGGRLASAVSRSEGLKDFAAKSMVGGLALKGIRGVAGSYDKKLESQIKARTEFAESLGYNKTKARELETELRDLKRRQQGLAASGDRGGARAMQTSIDAKEEQLDLEKTGRKESYADRLSKTGSAGTLFTMVARKNADAAAKIQGETLKARLEKENKALTKIRDEMKSKRDAKDALEKTIESQNKPVTAKQLADLAKYEREANDAVGREGPQLAKVLKLEEEISNS